MDDRCYRQIHLPAQKGSQHLIWHFHHILEAPPTSYKNQLPIVVEVIEELQVSGDYQDNRFACSFQQTSSLQVNHEFLQTHLLLLQKVRKNLKQLNFR